MPACVRKASASETPSPFFPCGFAARSREPLIILPVAWISWGTEASDGSCLGRRPWLRMGIPLVFMSHLQGAAFNSAS